MRVLEASVYKRFPIMGILRLSRSIVKLVTGGMQHSNSTVLQW